MKKSTCLSLFFGAFTLFLPLVLRSSSQNAGQNTIQEIHLYVSLSRELPSGKSFSSLSSTFGKSYKYSHSNKDYKKLEDVPVPKKIAHLDSFKISLAKQVTELSKKEEKRLQERLKKNPNCISLYREKKHFDAFTRVEKDEHLIEEGDNFTSFFILFFDENFFEHPKNKLIKGGDKIAVKLKLTKEEIKEDKERKKKGRLKVIGLTTFFIMVVISGVSYLFYKVSYKKEKENQNKKKESPEDPEEKKSEGEGS